MKFVLVIDMSYGVRLRIPGELEVKHFSTDRIQDAGVAVAEAMGGRFSHWEDAE